MIRPYLPLNSLRAFEAAARHLSFTNAAIELRVTPAALSHQVKGLEDRLGFPLFKRLPRGLALTDEGTALFPALTEGLDRIADAIGILTGDDAGEIVSVGVVGTFAVGWLYPRLDAFLHENPDIDLRISTHNNRVDLPEEGLDLAIRFGDGAWHGTEAIELMAPLFAPLCAPEIGSRLRLPDDLLAERLLRSYRVADWSIWFERAGMRVPLIRGPMFDSARLMVDAAVEGVGVALAPPIMVERLMREGRLLQPFDLTVSLGAYYLTHLKSQPPSGGAKAFAKWVVNAAQAPTL